MSSLIQLSHARREARPHRGSNPSCTLLLSLRAANFPYERAMSQRSAIRDILRQHARLATEVEALSDDADLFNAGLTSHATVNLMVALEDHFEVEFPERLLRRRSFESVSAIAAAITELTGKAD